MEYDIYKNDLYINIHENKHNIIIGKYLPTYTL